MRRRLDNESWPPNAATIRDQEPIDIWVRVQWQDDGEETIASARARRWTASHVFCTWTEPGLPIDGLWVRAHDVRRRA